MFLKPFQDIVDTYGVPVYKEVNPTVFTIVTFPFLFGVMFGDIGHGGIVFLFSAGLWIFGDKLKGGPLESMANIRYLLLLLGFFATFWGVIYNDFMSLPVEIVRSWYDYNDTRDELKLKEDWVYPFGIDHGWYLAKNELTYFNSLKMKLSVIFGVSQMSLGIFMKATNALYFKEKLDFYFEFIPQILLLWSIFGYMITLIIVKWLTLYQDTSIAPSIIGYMIEMFLNFGSISGDAIIHSNGLNEALHVFLLLLAFCCVPAMLIAKPCIIFKNMHGVKREESYEMHEIDHSSRNQKQKYQKFEEEDDHHIGVNNEERKKEEDIGDFKLHKSGDDHSIPVNDSLKERLYDCVEDLMDHGDHSISEIAIHQLIETIEFVLGTISNTASYLRLWALSLAHSQLAAVFFEKTLEPGLDMDSSLLMFLSFPIFATATLGVLLWMDSMEWFLHTLRLHWVEFQNKFFKGTGYKFKGFSLSSELNLESPDFNQLRLRTREFQYEMS
jgi:V-type H+-transporting ATPase subunit a